MQDTHPICKLAHGDLHGWLGLQPFSAAAWTPCLKPTNDAGWIRFQHEQLAYRVFHLVQPEVQVWLFAPSEADVCLVEVFGLPERLSVDTLGLPDLCFDYPIEARLQRSLGDPAKFQQECVYGQRGLSLLFTFLPGQMQHLLRVRGFHPMSVTSYRDRFVDLPPIRWFTGAE